MVERGEVDGDSLDGDGGQPENDFGDPAEDRPDSQGRADGHDSDNHFAEPSAEALCPGARHDDVHYRVRSGEQHETGGEQYRCEVALACAG